MKDRIYRCKKNVCFCVIYKAQSDSVSVCPMYRAGYPRLL